VEDIIEELAGLKNEKVALASLIWSSGSIPMSSRAKMLIKEDGKVLGTIGGGCLEAEILTVGREVIETSISNLTRYTMTEKQAGESGLNCGGTVRIFTESLEESGKTATYGRILQAREKRKGCVAATLLNVSRPSPVGEGKILICEDGTLSGTLGLEEADRQVLQQADSVLEKEGGRILNLELDSGQASVLGFVEDQPVEVFIEPFMPSPTLYLFGGGHVGGQICKLAKNVGFQVVVIDDRPMFANSARHPDADACVVEEMDLVFQHLDLDEQSYIVAATRGHQHDEIVIEQAVRKSVRYIGMLGSERKKMLMWKRLEEGGASRERLDKIYAPVGFNIGADTPEEIAVSVVAELIKVRRGTRKFWKTKTAEATT
jgi:xanthine dehydrogenase accessory factor